MTTRRLLASAFALLASACVPRAAPEAPTIARPTLAPAPAPATPLAVGKPADWLTVPIGAGSWTYRAELAGTVASWGRPGEGVSLALACDRASRTVRLTRAGGQAGQLTVTTTGAERTLPAAADPGLPGSVASLAAGDPFLDQLVFSRGRFLVTAPGAEPLVAPTWAEPFRVVEDCRG